MRIFIPRFWAYSFIMVSQGGLEDVCNKIQDLLKSESVEFTRVDGVIQTSRLPFPLFSWDKALYTKKNWVGLNPFVFQSGLRIEIVRASSLVEIHVSVNRLRTFVGIVYIIALIFIVFSCIPIMRVWMLGLCVCSVFVIAHYLSKNLLIKELANAVDEA